MAELDDKLYEQLTSLSEEGNEFAENEEFEEAVNKFAEALDLIPSPKTDWEASTWLFASIGDMYYSLGKYETASDNFYDALNCPGGYQNPFIQLRLGQCLYELDQKDKAKEYLLQAYMLDGTDIFSGQNSKYFELIQHIV
jgi:tetratricopeptide (TPR) repeat protein